MKKLLLALLITGTVAFNASAQNREMMIGCWTMPSYHPEERMSLKRDGNFTFSDWNRKKQQIDMLTGTWSFERGHQVTLYYEDRTKQTFTVRKNNKGKWSLTKAGGFMLQKADPSECN